MKSYSDVEMAKTENNQNTGKLMLDIAATKISKLQLHVTMQRHRRNKQ